MMHTYLIKIIYRNPKNEIINKALKNQKLKVSDFVGVKFKNNPSKAFLFLLKYEFMFIDSLLEKNKNKKFAIKVPKSMELDGENLKDIVFEPAIHGAICLNKNISMYVPKLRQVFLEPIYNKKRRKKGMVWENKCKKAINNLNHEMEIPDSKILSVMEKLDGSFNNFLEKKTEEQKKEIKIRIPDEHILSYILQISLALYHLYENGIEFNHRDFKPDNTMFINTGKYGMLDIDIEEENIKFKFDDFKQNHKIIDFGLSCIKYKDYNLNTVSYYKIGDRCFSKSRDLSQMIFIILNYHWNVLNDKIIGYLGYLLDINNECKLWRDLVDGYSNENTFNLNNLPDLNNENCIPSNSTNEIVSGYESSEEYVNNEEENAEENNNEVNEEESFEEESFEESDEESDEEEK